MKKWAGWAAWTQETSCRAKEGPLKLRRKQAKVCPFREGEGKGMGVLKTESMCTCWVARLKGFYLFSKGRNFRRGLRGHLNRIFISFSRCILSGHGLYSWVGTMVEAHLSLQLVLRSAMALLHLFSLLFWAQKHN